MGPDLRAIKRSTLRSVKFAVQCLHVSGHEMKHDARIAPGEPIDDGGNEARGQKGVASDPHFPSRGSARNSMFFTAWRRSSNTAAPPSSKARPYSVGSTPWRLRSSRRTPSACSSSAIDLEMCGWVVFRSRGRLPHAAGLHDGHQDVQVCSFIRRPMRSLNCMTSPITGMRYDPIQK